MFHNIPYANRTCRRQIEMSLSTVLVGEFWADDGDCDEPDGDRPDERVAGSGCKQDQSNGSRDADETWSASGVPLGQGAAATWPEESYVQGRIDGTPGRRVARSGSFTRRPLERQVINPNPQKGGYPAPTPSDISNWRKS